MVRNSHNSASPKVSFHQLSKSFPFSRSKSSMEPKLFLVLLLSASLMEAAKGQIPAPLDCLAKDGIHLMTCAVKCIENYVCLKKCGVVGLVEAAACYTTNRAVAEGPHQAAGVNEAVAMITSSSTKNRIEGSLQFHQSFTCYAAKTRIQGRITGLAPGKLHGLHIHFNSSCEDHPNHDGYWYMGLGNVIADENGMAEFSIAESSLTVAGGAHSVLGQALVVHPQPDDHKGNTETTGKYCTERVLACGIIQLNKA